MSRKSGGVGQILKTSRPRHSIARRCEFVFDEDRHPLGRSSLRANVKSMNPATESSAVVAEIVRPKSSRAVSQI
jgi:hypothetical protein